MIILPMSLYYLNTARPIESCVSTPRWAMDATPDAMELPVASAANYVGMNKRGE